MPPDRSSFNALNTSPSSIPEWMGSFTLSAPPNTDLWRKPPGRDTSTAPILYTVLRQALTSAEVTISADWELEWDQGGLVIFAGTPPGQVVTTSSQRVGLPRQAEPLATHREGDCSQDQWPCRQQRYQQEQEQQQQHNQDNQSYSQTRHRSTRHGQQRQEERSSISLHDSPPPAYNTSVPLSKWVKVGIEYRNGDCWATSVCATAEGADWAATSLPPTVARRRELCVRLERVGYALWLWYEVDSPAGRIGSSTTEWRKLREFTGFFYAVEDKAVRVGVWACRPAYLDTSVRTRDGRNNRRATRRSGNIDRNLYVHFEGLEIL